MYQPKSYTVESVTSGHPDKVCDQISDAILDECLCQDPLSRVAVEAFGSHGLIVIGGEVTSNAKVDYENVARRVYSEIGYLDHPRVIVNVVQQSPEIGRGVDTGGAGDQGIMYGYATDETPEFLPLGVVLAHKLTRGLDDLRRSGALPFLLPDGKSQVTIEDGKIKTLLVSAQHSTDVDFANFKRQVLEKLFAPLIVEYQNFLGPSRDKMSLFIINPAGPWSVGGFEADTGLTGRKIMVDTYGGLAPHGGGAFSGKDPTKVDRSAAYFARYVAKNLVASGKAKKCLVSVAYAIGVAEPVMVETIDELGNHLDVSEFDFRPASIIRQLNLLHPIYHETTMYGHFGKKGLSWECL